MAAAQLIATGTGAANSDDITIADGSSLTVGVKGETGAGCLIDVYVKDDGSAYRLIATLDSAPATRSTVLSGPGIYRLSRRAGSASCGAFSA